MSATVDPVALTQALVRRPSVTPEEGGCFDLLEAALQPAGFRCERVVFASDGAAPVANLVATVGRGRPHLAWCGHVDVVPPGDVRRWADGPFSGAIRDGRLHGRGSADMKSGVAAFVAASLDHLAAAGLARGAVTMLVTADEEGPSVDGIARLMPWAAERGLAFDGCIVAEPTALKVLGDAAKIGRRGSLKAVLRIDGRQGHTAYPERADNAAHRMVAALHALTTEALDGGNEAFAPTSLQVASVDVGNPAANVIPATATALIDVRFGDLQTAGSVEAWMRQRIEPVAPGYALDVRSSGEAFRTAEGPLSAMVTAAVREVTGLEPAFNTAGGTSDARFVKDWCPVVELGLPGPTLHQVDEHVVVADVIGLTAIYRAFLRRWFATPG